MSHRLPAEWEPQSAVMFTWPHARGDWENLAVVEAAFTQCVAAITPVQIVLLVISDRQHLAHVRETLTNANIDLDKVRFYLSPSNDSWARDHGPITVINDDHPVILKFRFNGWGEKYAADKDNLITINLRKQDAFNQHDYLDLDIILEGGSIDTNGHGALLTTESCLLSDNRNHGWTKKDYAAFFNTWFNCDQILWLSHGKLTGDDTDGHVDMLARFVNEHTIVYSECLDPEHNDYQSLQSMKTQLQSFHDFNNKPYHLLALPLPQPVFSRTGQQLPASYVNFIITNQTILMPAYADPMDEIACDRIQDCFKDREIIKIDARPLIEQYGSLHCISMQLPAGVIQ